MVAFLHFLFLLLCRLIASVVMRGLKRRQSVLGVSKKRQLSKSMTVAKLDAKLKAYRRRDTEFTQYQLKTTGNQALNQVHHWNLTDVGNWQKRFGPDPGGMVYGHKIDYDLYFKANTEDGPTTFTAFIVALRPDTADQCIKNNFEQNGPSENLHYISGQQGDVNGVGLDYTSGQIFLNPQYFIVKKEWTFTLGPLTHYNGSSVNNVIAKSINEQSRRFRGSIPWPRRLHSARGNFEDMTTIDNSAKLYLLVFTDNLSAAEGAPTLHGHVMGSVKST